MTPARRLHSLPLATLAWVTTAGTALAQDEHVRSSETGHVALRQALLDSGTDILALLVAAHPDDTYLALGAYLRFAYGWRVDVVLLTRGEGGQNLTGPEVGEDLRRVRTREAEAAAEKLGLRLWYANLPDNGYSRSAAETFVDWNRDLATRRLAQLVRKIRPDVVMTTHHPRETHGHDLACLELLPAAVALAGSPKADKLTDPPHVVDRLFRAAIAAKKATRPDEADEPAEVADLIWDLDEVESTRGETYRRIAYRVLEQEHRTQRPFEGIETLIPRNLGLVAMAVPGRPARSAGSEHKSPLPEEQSLLSAIYDERHELQECFGQLRWARTMAGETDVIGTALRARRLLGTVTLAEGSDLARRRARRIEALDRVLVHAAAVSVEVETERDLVAVPGEPMRVSIRVHNGSQTELGNVQVVARGSTTLRVEKSGPLDLLERRQSLGIEAVLVPSASGLESRAGNGSSRDDLYQQDRYEPPIQLELRVRIQRETIAVPFTVPIDVRPAVQLIPLPRGLLLPTGTRTTDFVVRVRRNSQAAVRERFRVLAPNAWATGFPNEEILLDREAVKDYPFSVALPELVEDGSYTLNVSLGASRMTLRARKVDLVVDRKLTVGLIRGADDATEGALRGLGVQLRVLNDDQLDNASLAELRTIVVDIRALKLREGARASFPRLLRFVEAGGRLVVLYHKDVEFNVDSAHYFGCPYPLVIGKGRITNERAPVTHLAPDHPLLNVPNRIREQDWDAWEQERGLYFAEKFDSHYEALLSIREDKDAPEQRGALLYAKHGRGDYVYCALALFRQLKFLHPGACRLLANLITPRSR